MDTLHDVMHAVSAEPNAEARRRDHLTVFREFLDHLEQVSKRRSTARSTSPGNSKVLRAR